MKGKQFILLLLIVLGISISLNRQTWAQTGGGYDLTWHTIDGGGGQSSGGGYQLQGTIGQPDAGASSGGDYSLQGGIWGGGIVVWEIQETQLYLPMIQR